LHVLEEKKIYKKCKILAKWLYFGSFDGCAEMGLAEFVVHLLAVLFKPMHLALV
jgi:hypothetical protein